MVTGVTWIERAPRRGRNADMRPQRCERAGLRRDGLGHVPEQQRFDRRERQQDGIDELLRIGRIGDQHAAAQAARGQADEGRDAVQHRRRGCDRCP